MKPSEFWVLTYAEFIEIFKGYQKSQIKHINDLITVAWRTAAFQRYKKLPDLEKFLIKESDMKDKPKPQTGNQMMKICRMWNAALGGKEIKT